MKLSFNIFILIFIISFLIRIEAAQAQESSDNLTGSNSTLDEKLLNLNATYDQSLSSLSVKKQNINETQLEIIKVKNTLLLLNDLPL